MGSATSNFYNNAFARQGWGDDVADVQRLWLAGDREAAAKRIGRVLWNDPATGVMRHADAGYEIAIDCAKEKGLDLPGILG